MSRATMRNLADVSYPLRHILRRVFAYLQDTILDEFPWLVSSTRTLEILESKRSRGTLTAKHVAAELLTFAAICAFLVVLIILSLKFCKEDEDEEEGRQPENTNNETADEPSAGSTYTLALNSDDSKENLQQPHDRGDSPAITSLEGQVFANRIPNVTVHNFIGTVGPSVSSAREPLVSSYHLQPQLPQQQHHHHQQREQQQQQQQHHHHQQREQQQQQQHYPRQRSRQQSRGYGPGSRCSRQSQRPQACRNLEWFVRRTRSGQIYGTYPF